MALTDGCLAYWRLDEASGARVDASGNGRDMSAQGSPGNRAGKLGDALDVSVSAGGGNYVYRVDSANVFRVPAGVSLTCSFWINLDAIPGSGAGYPISRHGTGDWLIYITTAGAVKMFAAIAGSSSNETAGTTLTTGAWYHVIGSLDHSVGTFGTIYSRVNNGTPLSTALTNTKASDSGANLSIGDLGHTAVAFGELDAAIDDVGIWNRILTEAEQDELWNDGDGFDPFATASGAALLFAEQHRVMA